MAFVDVLIDYSTAEAKRSGSAKVESQHVVAALFVLDRERMEAAEPDIERLLEQTRRIPSEGAEKPDGLSDEVAELFKDRPTEETLWAAVGTLLQQTRAKMNEGDQSLDGPDGSTTSAELVDFFESLDSYLVALDERVTAADESVTAAEHPGVVISPELAENIASVLEENLATVVPEILSEAALVCNRIAPASLPLLVDELRPLGDLLSVEAADDFRLCARLCSHNGDGAVTAKRLAQALVGTARFCAAADDEVTKEETDKIDQIRITLRAVLSEEALAHSDTEEVFARYFSDLIGLTEVKAELRRRIDFYLVSKMRSQSGRNAKGLSMHMAFVGSPGTGKTEVARRYAQVLRDLDVLSRGQLIEVDRSGLIGGFVGETERKTNGVVDSAIGGILFIDEAYALFYETQDQKDFGRRALDSLVTRLENDRERFVAVFAGYSEEMAEMLKANPGLQSRIPTTLDFPDYSKSELFEIAMVIATERGYRFDDGALRVLEHNLDTITTTSNFGNARYVRNLLEDAERALFARLSNLGDLATEEEWQLITAEDIRLYENQSHESGEKGIGFYL